MAHSVGESAERHGRSGGMSMGLQIAFALCQPGWTSLFCGVTGAWDCIIHEIPCAIFVALLDGYNTMQCSQDKFPLAESWCSVVSMVLSNRAKAV